MKKSNFIKFAVIGMVVGAGVGAMMAPKQKTISCATLKAARAIAGMVDSIATSLGL